MCIGYEVWSEYLSVLYLVHTVQCSERTVLSLFVGIPGDTISSNIYRVSGRTSL